MPNTAEASQLLSPDLLARLERLELVSRKVFRGRMKGERRSRRKGQSVEFADFRSYVPGDDLRLIDWNLYARLDQLFLKLFLEEEDLHLYALVDASESMNFGDPTKLFVAKQLAAVLGYIGLVVPTGSVLPRSGRRVVEPPYCEAGRACGRCCSISIRSTAAIMCHYTTASKTFRCEILAPASLF